VYFFVSFHFVCQYVSQVIGWEDYTLVISFMSKGFPNKDQSEELFIVAVLLYVFPTRNIIKFVINLTCFYCNILLRSSPFVQKMPLNPSINQLSTALDPIDFLG